MLDSDVTVKWNEDCGARLNYTKNSATCTNNFCVILCLHKVSRKSSRILHDTLTVTWYRDVGVYISPWGRRGSGRHRSTTPNVAQSSIDQLWRNPSWFWKLICWGETEFTMMCDAVPETKNSTRGLCVHASQTTQTRITTCEYESWAEHTVYLCLANISLEWLVAINFLAQKSLDGYWSRITS